MRIGPLLPSGPTNVLPPRPSNNVTTLSNHPTNPVRFLPSTVLILLDANAVLAMVLIPPGLLVGVLPLMFRVTFLILLPRTPPFRNPRRYPRPLPTLVLSLVALFLRPKHMLQTAPPLVLMVTKFETLF